MYETKTAAMIEIEKEIQDEQHQLASLEEQKKQIEAQIPVLRNNLDSLTKTMAILKMKAGYPAEEHETQSEVTSPTGDEGKRFFLLMPGSHSYLAASILKEQGNALSWSTLTSKAKERHPDIKERSFKAAVYRLLSEGKVFKKAHNKVGLLEWEKTEDSQLPLD